MDTQPMHTIWDDLLGPKSSLFKEKSPLCHQLAESVEQCNFLVFGATLGEMPAHLIRWDREYGPTSLVPTASLRADISAFWGTLGAILCISAKGVDRVSVGEASN